MNTAAEEVVSLAAMYADITGNTTYVVEEDGELVIVTAGGPPPLTFIERVSGGTPSDS